MKMREYLMKVLCVYCVFLCGTNARYNASSVVSRENIRGYTFLNSDRQENKSLSTMRNLADLWKVMPLNIMENSVSISTQCSKAYNRFLTGLRNNELISTKMFDATAKLPSGILSGNVNQYGDFDECMELPDAQYCLAEIDIESLWKDPFAKFKPLVHSYLPIVESFNDPKHRVPGFSMLRWGFCIPKECTNRDLENAVYEKIQVRASVRPSMCQKSDNTYNIHYGTYVTFGIFVIIGLCIILSSLLYRLGHRISNHDNIAIKILLCFSLQNNFEDLVSTHQKSTDIKALHGVRALSAIALIISHKIMALFYNPFINRTKMIQSLTYKWTVIGRTAILYTECFMVLSGFLNAYSLFSDLDKSQTMKFKSKLINRIFRIIPNLVAVILFCTFLLPLMGSGPLWPLVVNHHAQLCKKHMWRNIFFIHNYFGFENMCLTHTHQIGIDMQLFIITPPLVYALWQNKTIGIWILGIISVLSTVLRFVVTWQHELSHIVHFGIPISRLFKTADLSYILPTHRATIYFIGIYLAYIIRYSSKKPLFSNAQIFTFWGICFIGGLATWIGPMHTTRVDFQYDVVFAAFYGALSPILWGGSTAWVIYAVDRGLKSWLGAIFTWKYFIPFTKIGYAVYLVQFPVFFYNIGKTRHVGEYKPYLMLEIVETSTVILLSILLTVGVEMPFQNIRKVLFEKGNISNKTAEPMKKTVIAGEIFQRKSKLG